MKIDFNGLRTELASMLKCMGNGWEPSERIWMQLLSESRAALAIDALRPSERQEITLLRHHLIRLQMSVAA